MRVASSKYGDREMEPKKINEIHVCIDLQRMLNRNAQLFLFFSMRNIWADTAVTIAYTLSTSFSFCCKIKKTKVY